MAINIKKFLQDYKKSKSTLAYIKQGVCNSEKLKDTCGNRYSNMNDFKDDITNLICQYEASVYMIYNANGTINQSKFENFYAKFINADNVQKNYMNKLTILRTMIFGCG